MSKPEARFDRKKHLGPSINDVAARAGVAIGTVSNVLNHPDKVSAETADRVRAAIRDLNYVRNTMAHSLAAGRTRTIGYIPITISNSLFVDVARGAQQAATTSGMNLLIADSADDSVQQDTNLDLFDAAQVAGIILAPMEDPRSGVERVRFHGRPVVLVNYATDDSDVCQVLIDNTLGGYLAARRLIDLGRTRLAMVTGREHLQPVRDRRVGVERAAREAGAALEIIDVADLNQTGGSAVGRAIAARAPRDRPDGVITVTDMLGMSMIAALRNHSDLRIPEDLAVMGCDNNVAAAGGAVPLSSVDQCGHDVGREAVRLLMAEVDEGADTHVHRTVVLQPSLVLRESTEGRV